MKIANVSSCLIVIFLLYFVSEVFSIKCFQCNSYEHKECMDLNSSQTDSPYLKDCEETYQGPKPFCRKTIQTILDTKKIFRLTRSCGWQVYKTNLSNCRPADTDFKHERSCQCFTDACNSAKTVLPIITLVTSCLIIVSLNRFGSML